MTKVKLLIIAVVVLVLVNIGALSALYFGRPGHHGPPHGEGPKAIVIERLHFDADQVKAYEVLIKEHRAAIDRLDGRMMKDRELLFQGLKSAEPLAQDSLLAVIAEVERTIESTHLAHFREIRDLCRADQLPLFEDLVDDLAGLFNGPRRKPH